MVRNRHQRPFSLLAPRLHKHRSTELVNLRLGCVMAKLPSGLNFTHPLLPSLLLYSDLARGDVTQRADESFMLRPCGYRSPFYVHKLMMVAKV